MKVAAYKQSCKLQEGREMKGQFLKHVTAASAMMLFLTQAVVPAAATLEVEEYTGERGEYTYNKGDFDQDGNYDPEDKYMQLQVLYDKGTLTPKIADEIYQTDSWRIYNPFMDPDNPAYYKAGPDITWELRNHTLTFTGSGSMYDYQDIMPNWSKFNTVVYEIVFDDAIDTIGSFTFMDFPDLEKVVLPENVTEIKDCAFNDCYNLYDVEFNDKLETIGKNAFSNCAMQSIWLPDSVKTIDYMAFANQYPLESVHLPDGLETIGAFCFAYCEQLRDCEVPATVKNIGQGVFELDYLWYSEQKDKGDFIIIGDGYLYGYFLNDPTELVLPEGIKHIIEGSFSEVVSNSYYNGTREDIHTKHSYYLKSIVFPESLVDIGIQSFYQISLLESVEFQGSNLKEIGYGAFMDCQYLHSVKLPDSLETIGTYAFYDCTSLEDINIPDSVNSIGASAFERTPFFDKLTGDYIILGNGILVDYRGRDKILNVPDGVRVIAEYSLCDTAATYVSLTLPDSVRIIKKEAISSVDLVDLNLNEGLEVIEDSGINCSDTMETLRIPSTLKEYSKNSISRSRIKTFIGDNQPAKDFAELYAASHSDSDIQPQYSGKDNSLDFATDCWSFANTAQSFDNTYYFTESDKNYIKDLPARESLLTRENWSGDCFGLTATVILAKAGIVSAEQIQRGANSLHDITPTKEVQSYINFYHNVQYLRSFTTTASSETQTLRLYHIIEAAKHVKDGELPFMISFLIDDYGHAVIGYAQEDGSWTFNGNEYDGRVLVWDPNFPNSLCEDSCLYYNSKTFDHCIPHYDVYVTFEQNKTSRGRINAMCNDVKRLNSTPYHFDVSHAEESIRGDLNNDGELDVSDAVLLSRHLAEDQTLHIPTAALTLADVNSDGNVSPDDVIAILRVIAKFDTAK